jgi:hypothetical protein
MLSTQKVCVIEVDGTDTEGSGAAPCPTGLSGPPKTVSIKTLIANRCL